MKLHLKYKKQTSVMLTEDDDDENDFAIKEEIVNTNNNQEDFSSKIKIGFDYSDLKISSLERSLEVRSNCATSPIKLIEKQNIESVEEFLGVDSSMASTDDDIAKNCCIKPKVPPEAVIVEDKQVQEDKEFDDFFDDVDDGDDDADYDDNDDEDKSNNENVLLIEMSETLKTQYDMMMVTIEHLDKQHKDAHELIDFICCGVTNIRHRNMLRSKMVAEVDKSYLNLIGNSTSSLFYLLSLKSRVNEMKCIVYDMKKLYTLDQAKPKKTCCDLLLPYIVLGASFGAGISFAYLF
jgi:hypothetical protein